MGVWSLIVSTLSGLAKQRTGRMRWEKWKGQIDVAICVLSSFVRDTIAANTQNNRMRLLIWIARSSADMKLPAVLYLRRVIKCEDGQNL